MDNDGHDTIIQWLQSDCLFVDRVVTLTRSECIIAMTYAYHLWLVPIIFR